jgi:hypothetical protein
MSDQNSVFGTRNNGRYQVGMLRLCMFDLMAMLRCAIVQ